LLRWQKQNRKAFSLRNKNAGPGLLVLQKLIPALCAQNYRAAVLFGKSPAKSISFRKTPPGRTAFFYIPNDFYKIFDFFLFLNEILLSFIFFMLPKFLYY
jgi:hypothetical protein